MVEAFFGALRATALRSAEVVIDSVEAMVGLFINTQPVRVVLDPAATVGFRALRKGRALR